MKLRRHHNNKGAKVVRTGKTRKQIEQMARRLRIPLKQEPAVAAALREMWEQGREQGISDVYAGKDKP